MCKPRVSDSEPWDCDKRPKSRRARHKKPSNLDVSRVAPSGTYFVLYIASRKLCLFPKFFTLNVQ